MNDHELSEEGIAIIGMAGRFPGAQNIEEFWRNLRDGVESIRFFADEALVAAGVDPALLQHPHYVKASAILEDIGLFDAPFFGFTPREAEILDPQQRLFLECSWQALEHAGYSADTASGTIGVYAGTGASTYLFSNLYPNQRLMESLGTFQVLIGNDKDFLPTRVSHLLNLTGPSVNVQTACSTSLVAVCLACQSLLNAECDMALAGGVSIRVPHPAGYIYGDGGIFSPDGHCRAFDADAQGTVPGNGVGVVVLKRLADARAAGDHMYAVIKGFAVNNDGAVKVSYTAPSVEGQAQVIAAAQGMADIDPQTVSYIEAHGTGTALGDPIEMAALIQVFRASTARRRFCAAGSVKTNIGHLDAAAGIAGLIKTVLALTNKQLPPTLHYTRPNPQIDFAASPFYVNTRLADWPAGPTPRRAGVSAFGIGGTNAHVVLEEAPVAQPSGQSRPWQLLVLSAKTSSALETATANLTTYLRQRNTSDDTAPQSHALSASEGSVLSPQSSVLADVAYTLQVGRQPFAHRRMLVCRSLDEAASALEARDPRRVLSGAQAAQERPVAFMFPGVGDHYAGMAQGLYQHDRAFRVAFDHCCELLAPLLGQDLRSVLYPGAAPGAGTSEPPASTTSSTSASIDLRALLRSPGAGADAAAHPLQQTWLAQPALFALEYALAQMWLAWGVRPQALIGYSLGEYVAACLAGVLSLPDALGLVARRAQLIDTLSPGAMLAVPLSEQIVRSLLDERVTVAAVNGPSMCVLAGPLDGISALAARLAEQGTATRRLAASHAMHSALMEPLVARLTRLVEQVRLHPPGIPYLSNVTGTWITAAEATDPTYWVRHLCQPVRFADGIAALWDEPGRVLLEVGPGHSLCSLALQHPQAAAATGRVALPTLPHAYEPQPDLAVMLSSLGQLWLAGVPIDWAVGYAHERRRRLPLPTYPFERQRYWIDPATVAPVEHDRQQAASAAGPGAPVEPPLSAHARPNLPNPYVAPRTVIEQTLAAIWTNLLGVGQVGVHDNFFALGGHSLIATQIVSSLRDTFQVELPLRTLFEAPTVSELAERIRVEQQGGQGLAAPPLVPNGRDGPLPLSFAQERLWFLDQLTPGNPAYHIPAAMRLTGTLQVAGLAWSLDEIVRRHEVLRTTITMADGRPVQVIAPALKVRLVIVDLGRLAGDQQEAAVQRLATAEAQRPFDLGRGPLLRVTLLRLGEQTHVLLLTMHHIVSDGWSGGVLVREIATLYTAFCIGDPSPLPALPIQYADYALWQRRWLQGAVRDVHMAYWQQQLAGVPLLPLPTDRPRPAVQTFHGAMHVFMFRKPLTAAISALSRREDATLFMILLTAFQILLARYCGQDDIAVGTPIANRTHAELEALIGCFVNTLVLRAELSGNPSFQAALGRVRAAALGAYTHQDMPFEQLVDAVQPARDLGHNPLFQVMFILHNTPMPAMELPGLVLSAQEVQTGAAQFDLTLNLMETPEGIRGRLDYNTDLFDAATIVRMVDHFETLLDGSVAHPDRRVADLPVLTAEEHRQIVVEWNATDQGVRGQGSGVRSAALCVHDLFEVQVARTPDAIAVVFDDRRLTTDQRPTTNDQRRALHPFTPSPLHPFSQHLTYRELNERANRLAHHLRTLGVGPEICVAICMERSPEMVVGLLGILKAGGAYVPLDPTYPAERLAFMLEDSQAAVLITANDHRPPTTDHRPTTNDGEPRTKNQEQRDCENQELEKDDELKTQNSKLKTQNFTPSPCHLVTLSREWSAIALCPADDPVSALDPVNLAYLIYTSGSTGRPKGVLACHRGTINRCAWMWEQYPFAEGEVSCQKTALSFVDSVWEIFGPLLHGIRTVIIRDDVLKDPDRLIPTLATQRVTRIVLVPSLLRAILDTCPDLQRRLPDLKYWVSSGEALAPELCQQFLARMPRSVLLNLYGSSEVAADATWYDARECSGASVPIGRPIANTQIYLLDRYLNPLPLGVPGEVYIGGAGLARGYHQRPDLTAERFVPNPFWGMGDGGWGMEDSAPIPHPSPPPALRLSPIPRLYKTGDLARYRPDGQIEYLGRIDHQVKVRGFRVELGEIEAVLGQHPAVRECVVVAQGYVSGENRLVAYVVPKIEDRRLKIEDSASDAPEPLSSILYPLSSELREFLKDKLPDYMVPATFVLLEALPVTPNGKIDRRALPVPDRARPASPDAFVAPRTLVERHLASMWAELLCLERVGVHDNFFELGGDSILSIRFIARAGQAGLRFTLRQIFQHQTIAELAALADTNMARLAEQSAVAGPVPLTPIQHWFFEQALPDAHHWNLAVLLETALPLDGALLARAVRQLILHHDALRLRFTHAENGWHQHNAALDVQPVCVRVDLAALPAAEQSAAIEAAAGGLQASLDLEAGPLLRVAHVDLGVQRPGRLLIIAHHLVVDGVSWRILLEDLQTAYAQLQQGKPVRLAPKTTAFKQWADRLEQYAQLDAPRHELAFWLDTLSSATRSMPRDDPQGANTVASARSVTVALSVSETRALLQDVPPAYQTQINDVLLAALAQAYAGWTGAWSLLIDLEGLGREELFDDLDLWRTVGWCTTMFPLLLRINPSAGPGVVLQAVKEQLRAVPNRGLGYGLLRYMSRDPAMRTHMQTHAAAEVSFNYLGQIDQAVSAGSLFGAAHESSGPLRSPQGKRSHLLEVDGFIIGGQLHFDWTYSEQVHRRSTIERLAQAYLSALRGLIAHCQSPEAGGYTPSDFPEMAFSQEELDDLIVELSDALEMSDE